MANERARHPRQSMTPQEVKLWVHLRSWRSRGYHFRRQDPRDPYIVDFVCMSARLIVEADGGQHADEQQPHDAERDAWLRSQAFQVIRFTNIEILTNIEGVQTVDGRMMASTLRKRVATTRHRISHSRIARTYSSSVILKAASRRSRTSAP